MEYDEINKEKDIDAKENQVVQDNVGSEIMWDDNLWNENFTNNEF